MKTFSELMELFDKEHEFTHTVKPLSDRTSEHRYEFDHKGKKFQAAIYHDKKTGESEVSFGDEHGRMGKTGESGKHSIDVFSKMASIIRHHVKTTPTAKEISFTSKKEEGEEGSRSSLYRKMTSRLGGTSTTGRKDVYHSIPADRMTEETREQKFARLRSDAAAFGKEIDAKRASTSPPAAKKQPAPDKPSGPHPGSFQNNPTNYSRKNFKDAAVSKEKSQTRPAPGNDELTAKTYAALGIKRKDQSRVPQEQPAPNKPAAAEPAKTQRPFPDKAPEKQFGQDTKMGLLKLNRKIDSDTAKVNKPEPKIGSLVNKQSGYPAARPAPTVAAKPDAPQKGYPAAKQPAPPKPTPRPEREQSFSQAFANARKAGLKKFSHGGKEYNTRVK